MECTITGWDINEGQNTVYADGALDNTVTLSGSGFGAQPNPEVSMTSTGYSFTQCQVVTAESNDTTLVVEFACEPVSKRFPRTGDILVNLTNPDGSITCTQVAFSLQPPPPPPNARSQS